MIIDKPTMGWNSWNTFGHEIDDSLIRECADAMVDFKLKDAGYDYIAIDDCWSQKVRGQDNRLCADKSKFPYGIKDLSDYVHKKGLKLGIYSCAGDQTCAGYPGSYEYEFIDAETFAEWDIDFLKYDYCFRPRETPGHLLYKRMGSALANSGRDIIFNACSWGADDTYKWIKSTGAHLWRSTTDILDSWVSIKKIALQQPDLQVFNGKGCFNDMDMLVVGMNGKGNVGLTGCSFIEYRTHFSLWSLLGSPLMIGCDIRKMSDETASILLNRNVIEINQDPAVRQPYMINSNIEKPIWVKMLSNGDYAIGLFNFTDQVVRFHFSISDLGINRSTKRKLDLRNLWSDETLSVKDILCTKIEPHDCLVYRAKVANM